MWMSKRKEMNLMKGVCFSFLFQGVSCEPGEVVFGCVLDWNFDKKLVCVSLIPELVAQRKAAESQKAKQKKVTFNSFVTLF